MANDTQRILDLIPESLRSQLFIEVQEELEKIKKKSNNEKATPEEIAKVMSIIR